MRRSTLINAVLLTAIAVLMGLLAAVAGPRPSEAEYGDITMNLEAEKAEMPPVVFPHWFHRIRFKCKVCHDDIFQMRAGADHVTMIEIIKGNYCGRCHNGRIAWAPLYCDRCHSGKSQYQIPEARGQTTTP
ncbi:MAG TPA: cytochrome c3 family protein [Nitrospiria bacterium]|nr:cytochrome c3 family protein [Nitrospiria bacterium]